MAAQMAMALLQKEKDLRIFTLSACEYHTKEQDGLQAYEASCNAPEGACGLRSVTKSEIVPYMEASSLLNKGLPQ